MLPNRLSKDYKLVRDFKDGGQSRTFLISKNENLFLVKVPLSNKLSKERKFRLKREVEALKLLNGNGVPKLIECDVENDVYIVMEYIDGKTLTEYVGGKALCIENAIQIITDLMKTVEKAHKIGLYHRDIKPDNIIIRTHDGKPIIIDFGICWLANEEDDFKTKTNIELGNRFLRLPELSKGSNVTISTSDVTFLVGILFYMLSGESPNLLLNEKGELPHQRQNNILQNLLEKKRTLRYIFDKGFTHNISLRYQTIEELFMDIDNLNKKEPNESEDSIKKSLSDLMKVPYFLKQKEIVDNVKYLHDLFLNSFRNNLVEQLTYGGNGPDYLEDLNKVETQMFLVREKTATPQVKFFIITIIDNNYQTLKTLYGTDMEKKELLHSVNELSKLNDDYIRCGTFCAINAMKELKDALQNLIK